jgi:hypothetical protein
MRTGKVSFTLQHKRLAGLLVEFEQEHGPIDPCVPAEVRRAWPAPGEKAEAPLRQGWWSAFGQALIEEVEPIGAILAEELEHLEPDDRDEPQPLPGSDAGARDERSGTVSPSRR